MQLVNEASIAGYFNAVQDLIANGIGPGPSALQHNITLQLAEQRAYATDVPTLIQHVADRLTGGVLTPALSQRMTTVLNNIAVPSSTQANSTDIAAALNKRAMAAILMVAVSPEFLVTK